jgi:hypothetical protein
MKAFLLVFVLFFFATSVLWAQTPTPVSRTVDVQARVGDFSVTISGYASPFASVVLTSGTTTLGTTTADANGNFTFSNVLVNKGFSSFCLTSIDFKRLGEAEGCLTFTPLYQTTTIREVFIPPTIGAFRKRISVGDEGIIWGYTMPRSTVTITIIGGKLITRTADNQGYYEYREKFAAGKYTLTSKAVYLNINSLPPTKSVEVESLTQLEEIAEKAKEKVIETVEEVGRKLPVPPGFRWVYLLIPILLLIGFIIFWPFIKRKIKRHHPLHHDWLLKKMQEK